MTHPLEQTLSFSQAQCQKGESYILMALRLGLSSIIFWSHSTPDSKFRNDFVALYVSIYTDNNCIYSKCKTAYSVGQVTLTVSSLTSLFVTFNNNLLILTTNSPSPPTFS